MPSADSTLTTLSDKLRRLGLACTADAPNNLLARATRSRWSPTQLVKHVVQAELDDRARRRLERHLRAARLGRFKPFADFEWDWPKQLHRPTVERGFKEHRGVRVLRVRGRSGSEDGQCASAE